MTNQNREASTCAIPSSESLLQFPTNDYYGADSRSCIVQNINPITISPSYLSLRGDLALASVIAPIIISQNWTKSTCSQEEITQRDRGMEPEYWLHFHKRTRSRASCSSSRHRRPGHSVFSIRVPAYQRYTQKRRQQKEDLQKERRAGDTARR